MCYATGLWSIPCYIILSYILYNMYWNWNCWLKSTLSTMVSNRLYWPQSCCWISCLWLCLMFLFVVFLPCVPLVPLCRSVHRLMGQCGPYVRVHALEFHTDHWLLRLFWCPSSQQAPGGVGQLRRSRFGPHKPGSDGPGHRFSTSTATKQPAQWVSQDQRK